MEEKKKDEEAKHKRGKWILTDEDRDAYDKKEKEEQEKRGGYYNIYDGSLI